MQKASALLGDINIINIKSVFREKHIERKREIAPTQEEKEKKKEEIIIVDEKDIEVVRGNPTLLRIKKEKAKEFGINPERYSREITPEEIKKLVNETCERNENLEKECLLICIKDLHTKLSVYKASLDLLIDKISKITCSQLSLKGRVVRLEGFGFCELEKENGKIKLRKIEPVLPGYIVSPRVLERDILEITSEVTGVPLEKLEKDLKKVSYAQPQDFVEVIYEISPSRKILSACAHERMVIPASFKPSVALKISITSMDAIHEMTHLESLILLKKKYKKYTEGEAILAEINGAKKLAEKWKDIFIRQIADLEAVLMPATWLAEYLHRNGEKDTEIIKFLQKVCPQENLLDSLFGEEWDQGKINGQTFEERRTYFARAYEIAKFFGENVKVSKISEEDWMKLLTKSKLRKKGEYKDLLKHPLEPEFLDYSLYEIGKPSLGDFAPPRKIIFLLKEKLDILNAEKELLNSVQREPDRFSSEREKILKVLKKVGLTIEKRKEIIEKEIKNTKEKLKKAKEGKMQDIQFEDLFWEI